ncbi:MAG: globin [Pseudomonadota bacterium]
MTTIPQFEGSFDRLFTDQREEGNPAFFRAFYDRFTLDEQVADLFRYTDVEKQVSMLKRSIYDLVGFYVTGSPSAELYRLAAIHQSLGIQPQLLDIWLDALLVTVAEFDADYNEEVRLGWIAALSPGLTFIRLELMAT